MTRIQNVFFEIAVVFVLTNVAFGAPSVSNVSGIVTHGQSIAISGSSFGTKSHAGPMLYDNFEGGTNGNAVNGTEPYIHQGNLSSYSAWVRDGGGAYSDKNIVFNNSSPKTSSALHARAYFDGNDTWWGLNLYVPYSYFTTGKELFVSFYYRFTGSTSDLPRQTKHMIAYDSSWNDKYYFNASYNSSCQSGDGYRPHITETATEHYLGPTPSSTRGEWIRIDQYLKQSAPNTANGAYWDSLWRPSIGTPTVSTISYPNQIMRTTSAEWTRWTFGGAYYSPCYKKPAVNIDIDDLYIDDSQARVEICKESTWATRTHCELQIPAAWSDAGIIAEVNRGYFGATDTAYVYVIDPTGDVNSHGFPVTFGAGGDTAPAAPQNLQIIN